jgi:aspartate racemase
MKIIGLIGGMSWESSAEYYRLINRTTRDRLGPLHSARSLMYTVDFHEIERMQHAGEWDRAGALLADAARRLERGGADCVVLCTNTMHKVAAAVEDAVRIPLLHIADATGARLQARGMRAVGLLGTRFTMEEDFYKARLAEKFGLTVLVPSQPARDIVHHVIYDELCQGRIRRESKAEYARILHDLAEGGAEGVVLGCTEITLLVDESDSPVPVFDTTAIHAAAAVDFALDEVSV